MQTEAPASTGAQPETEAPTRFGSFSVLKQRLKEVKQSTVGRLTQQQKQSSTPGTQQQEAGPHNAQDDDDSSTVISETSSVVQQKLEQLLRPAAATGPSSAAAGADAGGCRTVGGQTGGSGGLNLTVRRFKAPVKAQVQQAPTAADSNFPTAATAGFAKPPVNAASTPATAATTATVDGTAAARPHLRISLNGSLSRSSPVATADAGDAWSGLTAANTAADKGVSITQAGSSGLRAEGVVDGRSRSNSDSTPAPAADAAAGTVGHPGRRRSILDHISIVVPGAQEPPAAATAGVAAAGSTSSSAMKRLSSSGRPADAAGYTVGAASSSSQPASTAALPPAAAASTAGDCSGLQLQLPASRFREYSRDGSAAAATAAHPSSQPPPQQQQQQYSRAVATGPHIFAAFQVPAHLYNSQEDILNDTDIRELLGKVEQCVGAKDHPRIHWHMRTSSISSLGAEIASAAAPAAGRQSPEEHPGQGTTGTVDAAHQSLNGTAGRQIHVHVDEQDDGQLSVIISDMEDPDSGLLLPANLAHSTAVARSSSAGLPQQHTVLEVTASDHGSAVAGPPPVGSFSLAARRSSTAGGPAGAGLSSRASSVAGMRPTIGSMIAARISISDFIPAAVHLQQQQQSPPPQQQSQETPAAATAAAAPELHKSSSIGMSSSSNVRPGRRSIEGPPVVVGLSSAALAAAEEHQQQQPPLSRRSIELPSGWHILSTSDRGSMPGNHPIAATADAGDHTHGVAVQRVHSTVSNDDASSCCDSHSDLSLLANPLQFADTLKQRMSKHLWTPTAAAAAAGSAEERTAAAGECASPGSTAVRTAQQLDEYFKGHESLRRKAARFKLNLQQHQQQKQQLNHTVANPTASAAAADATSSRLMLGRTLGTPAGHLDSRLGHNATAAAVAPTKQGLSSRSAKILLPGAATSAAAAAAAESDALFCTYPPRSPTASAVGLGSGLTAAVNSLLQRHEQQQQGPAAKSSKLGAGSVVGIGANSSSIPLTAAAGGVAGAAAGPVSSLGVRQSLLRPAVAANSDDSGDGGGAGLNVDELTRDLEACLRKVG